MPSDIIILSVNAGSSSVKVSVFKSAASGSEDPVELAVAEIAGISAPPAVLKYTRNQLKKSPQEVENMSNQQHAFKYILQYMFEDDGLPALKTTEDINICCHRIVHGGDYGKVQRIDADTYHHLETLSTLAPLHNVIGLSIVRAVQEELPNATNMAYFDSAFHATIPDHIRTYAIDPDIAQKNKLRKYGFHGISYTFILSAVAKHLGTAKENTSLIALHLGSGASACAIRHGKSLDTSMGLTPLAGLPGGSRSGDVDPSLVFHYTNDAGGLSPDSTKDMHITVAEDILNKKSGFKALTGTADFGHISSSQDPKCKLAFDLFVDRVLGYIGSYFVKLDGEIDALVFAGGIGEKGVALREAVIQKCRCLGFDLDHKKNQSPDDTTVAEIASNTSKYPILICQTDEQFEMARGSVRELKSVQFD